MSKPKTVRSGAPERPEKPEKKKRKRSPGPKGRVTKRTGDVLSKPEEGRVRIKAYDPTKPLPGKAIRHLRGLGHHLDPVVQVGKEGVTEAVVTQTKAQLLAHELVKVKVATEAPEDRKDVAADLAERAGATLAQTLGRTFLLYKRHPHKPKIELPR